MLYSMRKSRRKEGYTSVSFQAFSVIMQCKFQSMYHLYGTCLSLQYTYCAISKIVKEFWKKIKKFLNLVILLFSWERYFVCIWEIAYKEKCKAVFLQWAYVFLLFGVYRETDTTESRHIWAYAANQSGDIQ